MYLRAAPCRCIFLSVLCVGISVALRGYSEPALRFERGPSHLALHAGDQAIATYVWEDEDLPRPYFKSLKTPDGIPVTRNYPPDPEIDKNNDDHPHFHPGAWMAFGDINGSDFWRNKARVRHERFDGEPKVDKDTATFAVVNAWLSAETNAPICEEHATYTVALTEQGYVLAVDTTFHPADKAIVFGDQEEMGFGVRVATPLSVRHGGGRIRNSEGGEQEAGTWGKTARWCAGFGMVDGRWAGINVMTSPENLRPSWFHSRDYGLILANPFGKKAMTGAKDPEVAPDRTPVAAGESLRLRFGLYVFSVPGDSAPDLDGMYQAYTATSR